MLILTTPILLPLVKTLGVDPIHFGIIVNLNITIGIITPPTGMGLYVVMGLAKVKFEDLMCRVRAVPLSADRLPDPVHLRSGTQHMAARSDHGPVALALMRSKN